MCVNFCLQDVQEGEERREDPQEHRYKEFIPTLLTPIRDERRPDTHTSSVILIRSASQGPSQDRRPWTEDPMGERSLSAVEEQRFHSHPYYRSNPTTRNRYGHWIWLNFLNDGLDKFLEYNWAGFSSSHPRIFLHFTTLWGGNCFSDVQTGNYVILERAERPSWFLFKMHPKHWLRPTEFWETPILERKI